MKNKPNPKKAYGDRKPPLHLVPDTGIILESIAFKEGARKYGPFNWRDDPVEALTYIGAARRHITAWVAREEIDPDSEEDAHHLGQARACLNIILDAQANSCLIDNRPKKSVAADLIRRLSQEENP